MQSKQKQAAEQFLVRLCAGLQQQLHLLMPVLTGINNRLHVCGNAVVESTLCVFAQVGVRGNPNAIFKSWA